MDQVEFTLDNPLVDLNFNPIEKYSEDFIKKTEDEFIKYTVKIIVDSAEMGATAMFFSMRKRPNVDFVVVMRDFNGADFFESFIRSGHIMEVINE